MFGDSFKFVIGSLCVASLVLAAPAFGQKTKAQLNTEVGTTFPDQSTRQITPSGVRTFQNDLINSIMPTAPVISGNLACFSGTTGLLQDCGSAPSSAQLQPYTAANTSPASQTIQAQLRKIPVSCEDFGTCGTTDDTMNVQAAINYAAAQGRCFQFNRIYTLTTIIIDTVSAPCMNGRGGLIAKAGSVANALLEIKDSVGIVIDGNISLNCSGEAGVANGFKFWGTGANAAQYNPGLFFAAIAGCKNMAQFGDVSKPDATTFSENSFKVGYSYLNAGGLTVTGYQAVVNLHDSVLYINNTLFPAVTPYAIRLVGGGVQNTGGEIVIAGTSGAAVRIEAIASPTYGNAYGNAQMTNVLVESSTLASIANPDAVSSPLFGALMCSMCYGSIGTDVGSFISAASDFVGTIQMKGNRFFAGAARSNPNIAAASATISFDWESFGTNMLQGYAGVVGGIQRMTSKDLAPGVVLTGTSSTMTGGSSIETFSASGTHTHTLLNPSFYPGRTLYLNNGAELLPV
ncbi:MULTISPECIES: hypothetical protein [unclassified Bradyrhizobium]|uniref:hypothetical protein n=2 Tax=unclassified Bradyrhizobium TaxID=2631580 RepID=UPI001FF7D876|nr:MULTISPECIES: hypothetical protein [unclassified Bradyrhizobium]MCK1333268.1 hypothetical protein [Bradyrhizobium sp. CW9]MCK1600664.1 hypothetical protein [Bradyrhizobium sp. 166]UPJ79085.1 hypothetical protein IVB17_30215 [Bradyrhizobium sp. 184]UPJ86878.1 hypothetical protein IVB16_30210 [Bradyrhizobium sp. 183]UPJ94727.1 hypothetical protein IVB07_30310 [Bradyrhizobium sp. 172]